MTQGANVDQGVGVDISTVRFIGKQLQFRKSSLLIFHIPARKLANKTFNPYDAPSAADFIQYSMAARARDNVRFAEMAPIFVSCASRSA